LVHQHLIQMFTLAGLKSYLNVGKMYEFSLKCNMTNSFLNYRNSIILLKSITLRHPIGYLKL